MGRKRKSRLNWQNLMTDSSTELKKYSFRGSFGTGDLIDHASFGKGYVTSAHENKIEVLFEDKLRILVHNIQI